MRETENTPARLGIISTNRCWGGSEELWYTMAHNALDAGHPLFVALQKFPNAPARLSTLSQRGAEVVMRASSVIREGVYRSVPGLSRRFRYFLNEYRCLERTKLDALCINLGWTYELFCRPGLPEFLQQTALPYSLVVQYVDNWTVPLNQMERALAAQLFRKARCVAFVADQNRLDCIRQLGVDLPNAVVVRNPLNLQSVEPVPWPTSSCPSIANVGRLWVKAKGQDVLLEVLGQRKWRDRAWGLNFYGCGADEEYLTGLTDHFSLRGRVRFHGHVEDIRRVWSENHMHVMPSRGEGTPLSLVESMICGRPAVVSDVGGNAEWIADGQNGFVAANATKRWLDEALERAWQHRDQWQALGQAARQTALQLYDPQPGQTLLKLVLGQSFAQHNRLAA